MRRGLPTWPHSRTLARKLTPRRKRVATVRVARSNLAVAAVNQELATLIASDLSCPIDRSSLRRMDFRGALVVLTTNCPPVRMRNYMLVLAHRLLTSFQ